MAVSQIGLTQWLAVGGGAALGAWSRWGLGLAFGSTGFAMGTLLANLIGGFLMGCALAYFANTLAQNELRLFAMTGFLGGLTTFSAFSAEAFSFLQKQQYAWLAAHMSSHVIGSLFMTGLGFALVHYLKN